MSRLSFPKAGDYDLPRRSTALSEIVHGCGAHLTFPPGMEGRKGRCPSCGLSVIVPAKPAGTPTATAPPAPGRSPTWRGDPSVTLDPPPRWEAYLAYLEGKGPAPRAPVIPANIMLREEAEAKWDAGIQKPPPSKFHCPGCKQRLDVGQLVCTKCGLDLRTGRTLDGKGKVTPEGEEYLSKIPWVNEAEDDEPADESKPKPRFPNLRRRHGRP
jgi:hypothetical protein